MTPIAVVLALLIGTSMRLVGGGGAILTVPALVHVGGQYTRMYDPKSVETVKGEVVSVDFVTPMKGMARGVLLVLKTEKESIPMHLGPSWFIENQGRQLEPKDTVEVKGARVRFAGKPAIIAAEVKKGDAVLTLRAESGFPAWSAMRQPVMRGMSADDHQRLTRGTAATSAHSRGSL